MANRWGNSGWLFFWAPKSPQMVTAAIKLKDTCSKKSYVKPRQHIKKQRHYFANKGLPSQGYGFSSSRVWMWELDHKESECWRIDAFDPWCWRRLLRVPWTTRRSGQSILNQSWIFIGRIDAEAETPILWPPDVMNWLLRKDPDA